MLVENNDFAAFLDDYRLTLDYASHVFGVSRRTVSRWRNSGRVSRSAAQLRKAIERDAPPWSRAFRRGHWGGMSGLVWEWRHELFAEPYGLESWQEYMRQLKTCRETGRALRKPKPLKMARRRSTPVSEDEGRQMTLDFSDG